MVDEIDVLGALTDAELLAFQDEEEEDKKRNYSTHINKARTWMKVCKSK